MAVIGKNQPDTDLFGYITSIREHSREMMLRTKQDQKWLVGLYLTFISTATFFAIENHELAHTYKHTFTAFISIVTTLELYLIIILANFSKTYSNRHAACFLFQNKIISGRHTLKKEDFENGDIDELYTNWVMPACIREETSLFTKALEAQRKERGLCKNIAKNFYFFSPLKQALLALALCLFSILVVWAPMNPIPLHTPVNAHTESQK